MKKGLFIVAMVGLVALISLAVDAVRQKPVKHNLYGSVVRLHDAQTGRFFCSGSVVSPTKIITAGHCLAVSDGLFGMGLNPSPIDIRSGNGKYIGTYGRALMASPQSDVGVITGDFSSFDAVAVESKATTLLKLFSSGSFLSCGFPYGGKVACFKVSNMKRFQFWFTSTDGGLWPGMSGGPVYDLATGKLVAVNSAVTENVSIFAPLIEVENMLGFSLN